MREQSLFKPYGKFLSVRFQTLLQYRGAAWAGIVCQFFWGMINIMVFLAFFRSSSVTPPLSPERTVAYIWLGQAFLGMLPWNVDWDMDRMVRDGSLCYELLRPLDLHFYWYLRAFSWRFSSMILRAIPQLVFASLVLPLLGLEEWSLRLPSDPLVYPLWIVTVFLALLLSAALTTVINLSLLWSVSGAGTSHLAGAFVTLFSGMVVPLPFFPDRWQTFLRYQPFHGLVDGPNRIFTGDIPPSQAPGEWALQIFWIAFFFLLGRVMVTAGKRRLVVQGG
ncbi:MAG: ABC-2 family transporter protein [Spirochaetales bacterium]|nr:ABC-2 family transporter protein [Spirochaetales bacterium]